MEGGAPVVAPAVDATAAPPAADAPRADAAPAPPKPPEKVKLKLDGAEEEVPFEEVLKRAQKASAADKRFEEAAKLKKEAQEERAQLQRLVAAVKENPRAFLADPRVGVDVKAFAQQVIMEQLKADMEAEEEKALSPEQKELRDLRRERAARAEAEAKAKADQEKAASTAAVEKHRHEFGTQILESLKAAKHLPQDPETALLVAKEIRRNVEEGRPYDVKDVVARLDAAAAARLRAYTKALGPQKVGEFLDPELRKALREQDAEEYRKKNPLTHGKSEVAAVRGTRAPEAKAQPKGMRESELRNSLTSRDWNAYLTRDASGRFKK